MSVCEKCGHSTPTTTEKLRGLFAARVGMPARVNRRNPDASTVELATEILAKHDSLVQSLEAAKREDHERWYGPLPVGVFWESEDGSYTREMRNDGAVNLCGWTKQYDDDGEWRMSLNGRTVEHLDRPAIWAYVDEMKDRKQTAGRTAEALGLLAEDVIDPRSACPDFRRAVGFADPRPTAQNVVDALRAIEDITGEEPERFDECTGPMGGGL